MIPEAYDYRNGHLRGWQDKAVLCSFPPDGHREPFRSLGIIFALPYSEVEPPENYLNLAFFLYFCQTNKGMPVSNKKRPQITASCPAP